MHRAREIFHLRPLLARAKLVLAALAGLAAMTASLPARAADVPQLFAVLVPDADAQRAVAQAMRIVLVRLTGSRDAASDPALGSLVDDAAHYVRLERTTTAGATQVIFDDLRLREAVGAAGRSIWDLDRPTLEVWLPPADGATLDALRAQLTSAAEKRGLPLLLSTDAAATDGAAALAAARRAGANAALLGQSAADSPGAWQWTLVAADSEGHWTGSAADGIDGASDALVHSAQSLAAAPVASVECRITGVADLSGYSDVLDAVRRAPGVTAVSLRDIDGDALLLQLAAHGTPNMLSRALSSERLRPLEPGQEGALAYRYQAGP
jgi:hypothetical protein